MSIDLFPIDQCAQYDVPGNIFGTGDRLVSHPVEADLDEGSLNCFEFEYSESFLHAAKFIVDKLPEKYGPSEDIMLFPLLFLCLHSIEHSLKYMLSNLKSHILNHDPSKNEQYTKGHRGHDLKNLIEDVRILLDYDALHKADFFESMRSFINELSDIIDESQFLSLRYVSSKDGKVYTIRKKRLILYPANLIKNTEAIRSNIRAYVENMIFCDPRRIKELEEIENAMDRHKDIFHAANKWGEDVADNLPIEASIRCLSDITAEELKESCERTKILQQALLTLDNNTLENLIFGLQFKNDAHNFKPKRTKHLSRDLMLRDLITDMGAYTQALRRLRAHISYLKKRLD